MIIHIYSPMASTKYTCIYKFVLIGHKCGHFEFVFSFPKIIRSRLNLTLLNDCQTIYYVTEHNIKDFIYIDIIWCRQISEETVSFLLQRYDNFRLPASKISIFYVNWYKKISNYNYTW